MAISLFDCDVPLGCTVSVPNTKGQPRSQLPSLRCQPGVTSADTVTVSKWEVSGAPALPQEYARQPQVHPAGSLNSKVQGSSKVLPWVLPQHAGQDESALAADYFAWPAPAARSSAPSVASVLNILVLDCPTRLLSGRRSRPCKSLQSSSLSKRWSAVLLGHRPAAGDRNHRATQRMRGPSARAVPARPSCSLAHARTLADASRCSPSTLSSRWAGAGGR